MPAADFTFSGDSKLIVITSGVTTVDVQDMYSRWKQWNIESDNSKYVQALRTFGGDPTIAGQFAPRYYFLTNGWRVSVNTGNLLSVGTNLYTEELVSPYVIAAGSSVSDSNSDAVVVDNGIAEQLDYNGIVHINPAIGIPGTVYPSGTIAQPVTNFVDAKTIADDLGITELRMYGTNYISSDISNFVVKGGRISDIGVFLPGNHVTNTTFKEMILVGSYSGLCLGETVQLSDGLTGDGGVFKDSGLLGAYHINENSNLSVLNCSSSVNGDGVPSIHFSSGSSINLRKYSGSMDVFDCDVGCHMNGDFLAGNCSILTGNTAGDIHLRGIATIDDQSSGTTVNIDGLLNPDIQHDIIYGGSVNYDSVGFAGTLFPIGTPEYPVNNLTDALVIAANIHLEKIYLHSDLTLDQDVSNFEFLATIPTINFDANGFKADHCRFDYLTVGGDFNESNVYIYNSIMNSSSNLYGIIEDSNLTCELIVATGRTITINKCIGSDNNDEVPPLINMNPLGNATVHMFNITGEVDISNCNTTGSTGVFDFLSGKANLLSGNTTGNILLRGVALLNDLSSGTTVDTTGLLIPNTVAQQHSLNTNTEISKNQ